jgi:outer membrane protein assembly factor BamA
MAGFRALSCLLLLSTPALVAAQEPETRAEALQAQREQKSKQLEPPATSRLERLLLELENRRTFERLLNPPEGLYPKLGNVTAGSGFSFGPGYRRPQLFGGHADFSAFAAASFTKYWMIEGRLVLPRLVDGRVFVDLHARRSDFPEEDFFGLGPDSLRENDVTYGLFNTTAGVITGYMPVPWFTLAGTVEHLNPSISTDDSPDSITTVFTDAEAPGLSFQPSFMRYVASADVNYREPRGNPRRGGRYVLVYQNYRDRDGGQYSFERVEADVQQYLPFLNDKRVIALRAFASVSDADEGSQVPFYYQRTLGGPDDLRGFRRFRFRDENMILLQAEYRWEIFTAMDGAIFYDAGKVASRPGDLDFQDLEADVGIGFRFGTKNGVFLRVEGAFGSSGGKHFILRYGHVF